MPNRSRLESGLAPVGGKPLATEMAVTPRPSVGEVGWALLFACLHRLLKVLRGHPDEELGVALKFDGGREARSLHAGPHHFLGELHALCTPAVDLICEVERFVEKAIVGNGARDETDIRGFRLRAPIRFPSSLYLT